MGSFGFKKKDWVNLDEVPHTISLFGFTSTSLDRDAAESYSRKDFSNGKKPVLYVFKWALPVGYYAMTMSPYSEEQEILLFDGLTFKVNSVEEDKHGLTLIHLE